ncbi:hypothetical protein LDENG_00179920 [Lucifuga dentata]|nr:hypothetical protein LDENG_00179920 [Lucifuga dentata]
MQSGRSWASPAQHRGTTSIPTWPNLQSVSDMTTYQRGNKNKKSMLMLIMTIMLKEDIIWSKAASDLTREKTAEDL